MQLTLHVTRRTPHGTSRLVQALSARSVKSRRVPSGLCRVAMVYGHMTMALHGMSTHTPPPPLCTIVYVYVGLVSVGNHPVKHAAHSLS